MVAQAISELQVALLSVGITGILQPKGYLFPSSEARSLPLDLSQNNPNGQHLTQILSNPIIPPMFYPGFGF